MCTPGQRAALGYAFVIAFVADFGFFILSFVVLGVLPARQLQAEIDRTAQNYKVEFSTVGGETQPHRYRHPAEARQSRHEIREKNGSRNLPAAIGEADVAVRVRS